MSFLPLSSDTFHDLFSFLLPQPFDFPFPLRVPSFLGMHPLSSFTSSLRSSFQTPFSSCFPFCSSFNFLRLPMYLPSLACIPSPHSCLPTFLSSNSFLGLFCASFFPQTHSSFHVTSLTLYHSSVFLSSLLYFLRWYTFPYNFLGGVLRLHPPPFWTSILNHLRGTSLFAVTILPSPWSLPSSLSFFPFSHYFLFQHDLTHFPRFLSSCTFLSSLWRG